MSEKLATLTVTTDSLIRRFTAIEIAKSSNDERITEEDVDDQGEGDDDVEDNAESSERSCALSGSGNPSGKVRSGFQVEISEAEILKKVNVKDSDKQVIPKCPTFYKHDDRLPDDNNDGVLLAIGDPIGVEKCASEMAENSNPPTQAPSISEATKTEKKWQPYLGVDRWSNDLFDVSKQQPKTEAELISTYGYDIRTKDPPPRNPRSRGQKKKTNNKSKPCLSDFPPLNERRDEISHGDNERRIKKSSVNERFKIAASRVNKTLEKPLNNDWSKVVLHDTSEDYDLLQWNMSRNNQHQDQQ